MDPTGVGAATLVTIQEAVVALGESQERGEGEEEGEQFARADVTRHRAAEARVEVEVPGARVRDKPGHGLEVGVGGKGKDAGGKDNHRDSLLPRDSDRQRRRVLQLARPPLPGPRRGRHQCQGQHRRLESSCPLIDVSAFDLAQLYLRG